MARRPGLSAIGTRRWGRIRLEVLLRDGRICHYCGKPGANTVDHVRRREDGGDDRLTNLVACCKDCQYPSRRPAFLERGGPAETSALSISLPRDASHAILSGDYGRKR